jgi:hypothetical protein
MMGLVQEEIILFIVIIALFGFFSYALSEIGVDSKNTIYGRVIVVLPVLAIGGLVSSGISYKLLQRHRTFTYDPSAPPKPGTPDEKQTPIFSILFGFLASLAITNGLQNYYDEYINEIEQNLGSLNDIFRGVFVQGVPIEEYIIPNLQLAEFFVIAIPLTHSLYVFLSSVKIGEHKKIFGKYEPLAIVSVFGFSIVQVAFLFFLGGSIAQEEVIRPLVRNDSSTEVEATTSTLQAGEQRSQINQTTDQNSENPQLAQSNAFLFWLTLTAIFATIGAVIARENLKGNTAKMIGERIPPEWIMLYVFTIAFLISISLTLFRLQLFTNMSQLVLFHGILLGVLILRAVLDYIIGRRIYFPESYPKS